MTTESKQAPRPTGTGVLVRSGAAALVVVAVVSVLGALTSGAPALAGALVGGLVAVAVFLGGSLVVDTVAGIAPGLSLLFALSTYLVQVLALGLFFVVLSSSGLIGRELDADWLAGTVIAVTACWLVVQVVLSTRARIPAYDLPDAP